MVDYYLKWAVLWRQTPLWYFLTCRRSLCFVLCSCLHTTWYWVRPRFKMKYSARYDGNVHDITEFLLEGGIVMQQLRDERKRYFSKLYVWPRVLWLSSSRLDIIFLKSFLLREAKISSWFFLLTTMWLNVGERTWSTSTWSLSAITFLTSLNYYN